MDKLGGRKMMISLLILVAGVAIDLVTERGLSQNLMILMLTLSGVYTAGNVVNKRVVPAKSEDSEVEAKMEILIDSVSSAAQQIMELRERVGQAEGAISGSISVAEDAQRQSKILNNKVTALLTSMSQNNDGELL